MKSNQTSESKAKQNPFAKAENTYIAEGLVEDCTCLIQKCKEFSVLNYEKFGQVWRAMKMASVFQKRPTGIELAEFSEEAVYVAKCLMIFPEATDEEAIAGLFLTYAFLRMQPYENFACLRITPDDIPGIQRIETVARQHRRRDVLYILGEVLIRGSLQCHVCERERSIETYIKKYFDGSTSISIRQRHIGVIRPKNEEVKLISELADLEKKYNDAKKRLGNVSSIPARNLSFTEFTAAGLETSLRSVVTGLYNDRTQQGLEESSENALDALPEEDRISKIKMRAMQNAVNPLRHLKGVDDRDKLAAESQKAICGETSKKEKNKGKGKGSNTSVSLLKNYGDNALGTIDSSSDSNECDKEAEINDAKQTNKVSQKNETQSGKRKSSNIGQSPGNRKKLTNEKSRSKISPVQRKRRKKKEDDSSDTENSTQSQYEGSDTDPKTDNNDPKTKNVEKAIAPTDNFNLPLIDCDIVVNNPEIQIDNSNNLKIEIVDKYKNKPEAEASTSTRERSSLKSNKSSGNNSNKNEDSDLEVNNVTIAKILESAELARTKKRWERKELKLNHIKSTFKRLGISQVADWQDPKPSGSKS